MTTLRAGPVTTYGAVFAMGEFRALFAGTSVMVAGKTMEMLALSALVFAATGSPLLTAIAFLAGMLPQALGAATLLSLADRLPSRAFLASWDCVRAAGTVVLATKLLPVWGMLGLVMVIGTVDAVGTAIRNTLVVDVVPEGAYVLGRSLLNMAIGGMQIIGFAIGGGLLAAIGPRASLLTAAALALLCAATYRFGLRRRPPRATGRGSVSATWQGNRALLGDPATRSLLLAQWVPNGLIVGAEALFVPYAGDSAGALFTAGAAGMLTGDLVIGRWVSPRWRGRLIVPLYVLLAVPYLLFFRQPATWVAAGAIAIASFGYAGNLGIQERFLATVPESLRGQGFGLAGSGILTMQGVAAALTGLVAESIGPASAMAAVAVASLTVTALLAPALTRRPPEGYGTWRSVPERRVVHVPGQREVVKDQIGEHEGADEDAADHGQDRVAALGPRIERLLLGLLGRLFGVVQRPLRPGELRRQNRQAEDDPENAGTGGHHHDQPAGQHRHADGEDPDLPGGVEQAVAPDVRAESREHTLPLRFGTVRRPLRLLRRHRYIPLMVDRHGLYLMRRSHRLLTRRRKELRRE